MKALHFGAGKIGRGFIGAILAQSGYDVCFADVIDSVVDMINKQKSYTVHILDRECYDVEVSNVRAVNSSSPSVLTEIVSADLVTTAVSMKILPVVAPVIAQGLRLRKLSANSQPLHIISCENGVRATSHLKEMVFSQLSESEQIWVDTHVGFVDSSVDRIVPIVTTPNPLDVVVEAFYEWNVDSNQLIASLPEISGINITNNLLAHVERKLYTVNTGHCATAFLGNLKGYRFIHECLSDETLRNLVVGAMQQSGDALCAKFGFSKDSQYAYIETVLQRFSNPHIQDLVARVGHDAKRKLGAPLYFSYPISMAIQYHLPYDKIALVAAAGLRVNIKGDEENEEIRRMIAQCGLRQAISQITGHNAPSVIDVIAKAYNNIITLLK